MGDRNVANKHFIAALGVFLTAVILSFNAVSVNADHHLDHIEKNIALRRIEVANYYDRRIETLRIRANRTLALFEEAQGAKLYQNALHWNDYRYLPKGYIMGKYGRMISLKDIADAWRRIRPSVLQRNYRRHSIPGIPCHGRAAGGGHV